VPIFEIGTFKFIIYYVFIVAFSDSMLRVNV